MKKVLIIKADTNDGDYITSEREINENFDMARLQKVVNAIKDFNAMSKQTNGGKWSDNNWPEHEYQDGSPGELYGKVLTGDDIEFFSNLRPYGEDGIHTIESIRIVEIFSDVDMLK